jgi:hypothetical protein
MDNDGPDLVIVLDSLVQRLQDETSNTFATSEARLGAVIESISLSMFIEDTAFVSALLITQGQTSYPRLDMEIQSSGCKCKLHPATIAELDSPARIL